MSSNLQDYDDFMKMMDRMESAVESPTDNNAGPRFLELLRRASFVFEQTADEPVEDEEPCFNGNHEKTPDGLCARCDVRKA